MHKSGTTLVSQILHHSGINMVDDLDESMSYDGGNKYERQSILHLNMDILGVSDYQVVDLAVPAELTVTEEQQRRIEDIVSTCGEKYENWGFKDPRTCLVYPLWERALPEHKLIIVYRHPSQLWARFAGHSLRGSFKVPFSAWQYLSRWYEHNINILDYLRDTSREHVVLSYNKLMTEDREYDRLQEFVGYDLVDRRRKDLYRSRDCDYPVLKALDKLLKLKRGHDIHGVMDMLESHRG